MADYTIKKMTDDIDLLLDQSEERFDEIIKKTPAGVCITNEDGVYEYVNASYCKIYGYNKEDLIGKHFTIVVPDENKETLINLHDKFLKDKIEIRGEWEVLNKSGDIVNILADAAFILGKDNSPKKVTFVIDITDRKKAEEELEALNSTLESKISERTKELLDINSELRKSRLHLLEAQKIGQMGSWEWDIIEDKIVWSNEVYKIFGVDPESFNATLDNYMSFVHPDDQKMLGEKVQQSLATLNPYTVEHRVLLTDGSIKFVFGKGKVETNKNGKAVRLFGIVQDITDKKRIESEIKMLSSAIDESMNIIFITNLSGSIIYVNKAFETVTGYLKHEVINQNPRIFSSGSASQIRYEDLWDSITSGKIWNGEFQNRNKQGENFWVRCTILPIKDETGKIIKFMAIQEDISTKYLAKKNYKYLNTHDHLTHLYNRKYAIEKIEKHLFSNINASLIVFDIDNFNFINENYGNNTGDVVLQRSAGFFKNSLDKDYNKRYVLARFGENKFIIFLDEVFPQEAKLFANNLRDDFFKLNFESIGIHISISAGIVSSPDNGKNIDQLLNALDDSLFIAKSKGKNRCYLYENRDQNLSERSMQYNQRERILKALKEDRFEPWYQPIYNFKEGKIHHFEILARMRNEEGAIVLPGAFISAAESLNLIGKIDKVIAEKAMKKLKILNDNGYNVTFALNLSGKEIEDLDQLEEIKSLIGRIGVLPKSLIFEITETAAIKDINRAIVFIKELKNMGCSFSLDDFGVGFTSFSYLRDLDVDYIKIDGAFVKQVYENKYDQAIVKAMTAVAKGFDIQTIAEFVESDTIMNILEGMSVDYAQGYFIGKPNPEPQFDFEFVSTN
ncbi:EAL domain-containing protein [Thiospirochaeta perfilievii]|uniref:EAL domain-containing protein n=1 Tax=Thiospirochaeta perfilievii TaxID=252967 RepID=A0A5C1QDQ8_9SPIO|nr:EAL domain-containing protein [Thiospirochaeta perfilievii]QEN04332.1 EAL domain-containing protein [Thiospirochaeta perfilievii]